MSSERLKRSQSLLSLGGKINNFRSSFPTSRHLWVIIISIFASMAAVNGLSYVFVEFVINEKFADRNNMKSSDELDNPDLDIRDGSWKITDSDPIASLDETEFKVFIGFVLWVTVLLAGIGLEALVWTSFLKYNGWSRECEARWKFAEFIFPLFATTTLGLAFNQNYWALIFLVSGLFKFGFPEILTYMQTGIYVSSDTTMRGRCRRLANFLNAVGLAVHHSASALLICMLLALVATPDRHVAGTIQFLVMQHWFVLVKYAYFPLYVVLELTLEVFFEWAVLSNLQYLNSNHWTVAMAASSMLMAHWIFLLTAGLDLLTGGEELLTFEGETEDIFLAAKESKRLKAEESTGRDDLLADEEEMQEIFFDVEVTKGIIEL
jgi:hypothetical protein